MKLLDQFAGRVVLGFYPDAWDVSHCLAVDFDCLNYGCSQHFFCGYFQCAVPKQGAFDCGDGGFECDVEFGCDNDFHCNADFACSGGSTYCGWN